MALNKIKINDTTTVNTGVVYDITKATSQSYDSLSAALGTNGNNVPLEIREGGMTVRFVSNSNNKYVQYRLMSNEFTTDVTQWQGVDDEPIVESDNLVKSGGVYNALYNNFNIHEEWIVTNTTKDSVDKNSVGVYIPEEYDGILFGSWRKSANKNISGRYGYQSTGANAYSTYLYTFTDRQTALCVKRVNGGNNDYRAYAIFDSDDNLVVERKSNPENSNTLLIRCPVGYTILVSTFNPNKAYNNCFTYPNIDFLFNVEQIVRKETITETTGKYIGDDGTICNNERLFYSSPIPVKTGDIIKLYMLINAYTAPVSLWADSEMQNLIDILPNLENGLHNVEFICKKDGYVVISGSLSFLTDSKQYLHILSFPFYGKLSNLKLDLSYDDYSLGSLAASLLYRKSFSTSSIITKIAGYIRATGNIQTWTNP